MTNAINNKQGIKIFSCNANRDLAKRIAKSMGMRLANSEAGKFSDGETFVRINEIVRGVDCFIIQPTCFPVNDNLMELLIMVDALRRASAGRITAVIPYYGYARQDRKTRARDPISSRMIADIIQVTGVDRMLTMDLHCAQIEGFFTIPVDNMRGKPLILKFLNKKFEDDKNNLVFVSPDVGSVKRTRAMAEKFNVPIAIIDKRRPEANVSEVVHIIGDVKGKRAILVDDIIDTAGTITNAAHALVEKGATEVYACCTHAVLSGPAMDRINASPIKELIVLDTIPIDKEKNIDKITIISSAEIIAEAIYRINSNKSLSALF